MKNITKSVLFFLITAALVSCTKNFAKYNLDPDATTSVAPGSLFSDAVVNTSNGPEKSRTSAFSKI